MNDPKQSAANAGGEPRADNRDGALRARTERLRALQSAWGVLAPSGLFVAKQGIADAGRALGEKLSGLVSDPRSGEDTAAIRALDTRLDELEREMRDVALDFPIAQLRSTLPERIAVDRRGVLDLLDLLLGAEIAGLDGTRARIPMLDYLITLLCTGGDPESPLQDPVMLTPRLHGLCQRADDSDPRLSDIEAEFFAAAEMHPADVRGEVALRTLRRRKMELGSAFFAPRVLRSIMTYNSALLRQIDEEVLVSQDWGLPASEPTQEESASVFETTALPKLVEALRRRVAGGAPAQDALDRVAWCLDLAQLTRPEREALLAESSGRRNGLKGTTILAGLLCRSAVVLGEELTAIGIAPGRLSGAWLQEIDAALRQEVNRSITGDDYAGACVFSDLKSKFLTGAVPAARKGRVRPAAPSAAPIRAGVAENSGQQAKRVAGEAAVEARAKNAPASRLRSVPWGLVARAGAGALLVAVALLGVNTVFWSEGRVARDELADISMFLSSGKRSDEGVGSAFVGTLDEEWFVLGEAEQTAAAELMVEALRERGVREVMVYDDAGLLRVQALGSQSVRVVSGDAGQ